MEEILHQLIGSLSHYLHVFMHPRWWRISSTNSITRDSIIPWSKNQPTWFFSPAHSWGEGFEDSSLFLAIGVLPCTVPDTEYFFLTANALILSKKLTHSGQRDSDKLNQIALLFWARFVRQNHLPTRERRGFANKNWKKLLPKFQDARGVR